MADPLSRTPVVVVTRLTDQMERPALDTRSYRVIRLPNDLEALLIHDADTDKASAALDVNIGSFSDPKDMPGLAHAVEHMLFMGTEKVGLFRLTKLLLTSAVPSRERLQSIPDRSQWLFQCIHFLLLDELLL
jgi:hypothetical protein